MGSFLKKKGAHATKKGDKKMNTIDERFKDLVVLQATKIEEEFSIIDFTSMVMKAIDDGRLMEEAAVDLLKNLNDEYYKMLFTTAMDLVNQKLEQAITEFVEKRDNDIGGKWVEDLEDLEYLEEVEVPEDDDLEEVDEDDDLDYIISLQIRKKYIEIEKNQGFYSEEQRWFYQNFSGIDPNDEEAIREAERDGVFEITFGTWG